MTIIQIEGESGSHAIQSQSGRSVCWVDGYIEVPAFLEEIAWESSGWCDLDIQHGKLVGIIPKEKPNIQDPEPEEPTMPNPIEALEEIVVDQEYRLTLLELGVTQ